MSNACTYTPPASGEALLWAVLAAVIGLAFGYIALRVVRLTFGSALHESLAAVCMIALLGFGLMRLIETYTIYHAALREGAWVYLWLLTYSSGFAFVVKRSGEEGERR